MNNINQRLKRLTETDYCQAEAAEKYQKELIQLADEVADTKTAKKQSKLFKALSDKKRLQIIKLLRTKEKMCICELMVCLDMTQPNLSHHIQILENCGIVNRTKNGSHLFLDKQGHSQDSDCRKGYAVAGRNRRAEILP